MKGVTPKGVTPKERIVSGMRPTGRLHLGHYHGVLKNWLKLQDQYDCLFFIADWHGLTTEYSSPEGLRQSRREILADWLAVGLDPKKATIFVQSDVKEHAELHLLLSMITPVPWLERVPSYKEMQQELTTKDLSTYGFLGYPLLQTADIILYNAGKVPVGIDQVPHIELAREVVRRFNHLYGETFVEPKPLLTEAPKLLGMDRRKMSKSYDNCLYLSDDAGTIEKKVMSAVTDPARMRREDPGNPDICLIFDYHKLHSPKDVVEKVDAECRQAKIGCVEDKKRMVATINQFLDPIRRKREEVLKQGSRLDEMVDEGAKKARALAQNTMEKVRKAMKV
ncbi:MAG: tryptophan--tRNA ligase [Deltaproteobacteria bacterium]|nr:tryptophan--tRNA ligase [Deltaproteobacteria bacterium]